MTKKRVLALAFECNPEWPSLPLVAYNYARTLGEEVELTVVTQILNKTNIEKTDTGPVQFDYINIDYMARPFDWFGKWLRGGNQLGWTTQVVFTYPVYLLFEFVAWLRYRKRLKNGEFDLIHRLTPMTPTLPSVMAFLSPIPFVIGPLNGGLPCPPGFTAVNKGEKDWLRPLRKLYKKLPFSSATYERASAILAAFDHTIMDIPQKHHHKIIDFPEVGLDSQVFSNCETRTVNTGTITVLFIGRLVPCKLPDLVAQAFADSPLLRRHKLVYVGDGPERPQIEEIIKQHDLSSCTEITGWVTQRTVAEWMRKADILAFPSVRELGAGVVVESMACGLVPVVCHHGAPGTLVGVDRGVRLPVVNRPQLVQEMREALESLIADPEKINATSQRVQRFALGKFSWKAKVHDTLKIYNWVLNARQETKPEFWSEDASSLQLSTT